MGLFDSVWGSCPYEDCDGLIEWQSKALNSAMRNFPPAKVPVPIALDIENEPRPCDKCNRICYITQNHPVPETVNMEVVREQDRR